MQPNQQPPYQPQDQRPPAAADDATNNIFYTQPPAPVSAGKKLGWLWTMIILFVLALGGGGIGVFALKSSADAAAVKYGKAADVYLEDVQGAASSDYSNPSELVTAIQAVKAPKLEGSLLATLSSKYVTAGELQTKVNDRVLAIEEQLTGYGNLYDLVQTWRSTEASLAQTTTNKPVTGEAIYQTTYNSTLAEFGKSLDATIFPNDLTAQATIFKRDYRKMAAHWNDATVAYQAGEADEYEAALQEYQTALAAIEKTVKPLIAYYDGLNGKVRTVIADIEAFRK